MAQRENNFEEHGAGILQKSWLHTVAFTGLYVHHLQHPSSYVTGKYLRR